MILAIETSCDETAIAILDGLKVLSNKVASQIKSHKKYGGVVPELASRMHTESIHNLIASALLEANITFQDLTVIAATETPGLEGSLLIGLTTAKTLSKLLNIPFIPINHLHGHLYAHFLSETPPEFPLICLIASGGHTQLYHAKNHHDLTIIGQTRDDAAGEAFDKIARHLGLNYPGGPLVEAKAKTGNPKAIHFTRPMLHQGLEFSFSGLKTAVIQLDKSAFSIEDICASFQAAVIDVLLYKSLAACTQYNCKTLCIAGGVTANQTLTEAFKNACDKQQIAFHVPPISLCTDNAAMIGAAAHFTHKG